MSSILCKFVYSCLKLFIAPEMLIPKEWEKERNRGQQYKYKKINYGDGMDIIKNVMGMWIAKNLK